MGRPKAEVTSFLGGSQTTSQSHGVRLRPPWERAQRIGLQVAFDHGSICPLLRKRLEGTLVPHPDDFLSKMEEQNQVSFPCSEFQQRGGGRWLHCPSPWLTGGGPPEAQLNRNLTRHNPGSTPQACHLSSQQPPWCRKSSWAQSELSPSRLETSDVTRFSLHPGCG